MIVLVTASLLACTSSAPSEAEPAVGESPGTVAEVSPATAPGPAPSSPLPSPTPGRAGPPGTRRSAAEEGLFNASPWLAGRDLDLDRRWWAASEPRLAAALRKATLLRFPSATGRGIAIEVWEDEFDDAFQIAVHALPLLSSRCYTCAGETRARFVSASADRIRLEVEGTLDFWCPVPLASSTPVDSPPSVVELHADGTFVACGRSTRMVAGLSPMTRWWQLEQEAAGPVPEGFERCYVVRDPDCTSTKLRVRCIRPDGGQAFPDDGPDPLEGGGAELCLDSRFRGTRLYPEEPRRP